MFSRIFSQHKAISSAATDGPTTTPTIAPSGTSTLCKQCRKIVDDFMSPMKDQRASRWEYGKTVSLDFSGKEGCHLCAIVTDALPPSYVKEIRDPKKIKFSVIGTKNGRSPPYLMSFEYPLKPPTKGFSHKVRLMWYPEETSNHIILDQIKCDANWNLARQWFTKCRDGHKCDQHPAERRPTRLVELGAADGGDVRLVESSAIESGIEYCTVSHCWGTIPILRLLRENYIQFLANIPFASLSKTFQDVICAAQQFGFKYIWIDSLCIVQDDHDDWNRESATMADVYAGSMLNFAATAASNGAGGCFRPRDIRLVQPCKIYLSNAGANNGIYQCVAPQHWTHDVEASPLAGRAWVLQERILAPRTLHFGKSQLHWECTELLACESHPNGSASLLDCQDVTSDSEKGKLKQIQDPLALWQEAVLFYTRSRLTKEEDKLVALSGIAKLVHDQTSDDYVVGLWRKDLERQLLWKTRHNVPQYPQVQRVSKYRAPSWSWASIEGPTKLNNHKYIAEGDKLCCLITKVNVKLAGSDPFGQVSSASLRLKCKPLKTASSVYGTDAQSHPQRQLKVQGRSESLQSCSFDAYPPESSPTHIVYLMFISQCKNTSGEWRFLTGLILQKTTERRGEYKRLGEFFITSMRFHDDGNCQAMMDQPDILDENSYEDVRSSETPGEREYFITLV